MEGRNLMGAPNAQGIYVYDETDKASPVSTLLNKLGTSVTTVVTGIRSRLTALETAAPVAVINGRYTAVANNVASSSVTGVGAVTYVAEGSSTPAGTLWTRIANGWTFKKKGTYLVTIDVKSSALLNARTFIDVVVGQESYRPALTATNEDRWTATVSIVVPADDTNVSISIFQSTGAARSFTFRMDLVRLGTLT
jgi:hypothetical protein